MKHEVFLILGSNIQPEVNIPQAIERLSHHVEVVKKSSFWRTKAVGTQGPDFINLAVQVSTSLTLHDLKENILCEIETEMGRVRTENKYADRPIDLDIVIFDSQVVDKDICKNDYVILPFSELLPGFRPSQDCPTFLEMAIAILPNSTAKKVTV